MTNIENTQQAFFKLISPAHTTLVNFLDQILPSGPVKLSRNHIGLLSMPPKGAQVHIPPKDLILAEADIRNRNIMEATWE